MTSEDISREEQEDLLDAMKRNGESIKTVLESLNGLLVDLEETDTVQGDDLIEYRARTIRVLCDSKKHLLERNDLLRRSLDVINEIVSRKPNLRESDHKFLDAFRYLRDSADDMSDALVERFRSGQPLIASRLC